MNKGITILGLGPGDPQLISREAWDILTDTGEIYLRTRHHPAVSGFPKDVIVHDFDFLYDECDTFQEVYALIVERIMALGKNPGGVVYGVPGHPFVAESTGSEIYRKAKASGIPVKVCDGISFLEPVFRILDIDPLDGIFLADALRLVNLHHPPFPPNYPVLIAQIYDQYIASEVKLTLMNLYPDDHPVTMVHGAGTRNSSIENIPLYQVDQSKKIGLLTVLYLPLLGEKTSFEGLQEIAAHLRAPEGCPWDQEQTIKSMQAHLLEEAYEVLDAIDSNSNEKIKEELGDLLLVITMLMQIGMEDGIFSSAEVLNLIATKLIHRHPHVFSDLHLEGSEAVLKNWERIKAQERKDSKLPEKSLLDGVTIALPSLVQAQEYQDRAGRVGFDWLKIDDVWAKYHEEIGELQEAKSGVDREAEMGDTLFALVNIARWYGIDSEKALRGANHRFKDRFSFIEQYARDNEMDLMDMSLEEMDALWNKAKGHLLNRQK